MADQRTLTDRTRAADIRDWARDNGFTVSDKGNLPKGVVSAYEAAHDGELAAEDGPDWDAAADGAEADPLAGLESSLEAEDQAAAEPAGEEGPPPPANLEEARARLGKRKGKTPGWAASQPKGSKPAAPKVTRQVAGDIEGKLTLLLTGPALFWQMADPLCGGAFAENLDNIVRKSVPLICQSPDAVRWFTKGATFLLWLDLVWALQPVAQSVYAHHVAASVMIVDGRVVPSRRLEDGRVVPADQVPPPQRPDNSAYSTVSGHVPEPRAV